MKVGEQLALSPTPLADELVDGVAIPRSLRQLSRSPRSSPHPPVLSP